MGMPSLRMLVAAGVAALAVAPGAAATPVDIDNGVELAGGNGRAVLTLRGAVLGSLDGGAVTITARRGDPVLLVQGYERTRLAKDGGTTYIGRDLRFRVFRGTWRVVITGSGIAASAVGDGIVGLRGEGRYSIGGRPYRFWPEKFDTFVLGDPPRWLEGKRGR